MKLSLVIAVVAVMVVAVSAAGRTHEEARNAELRSRVLRGALKDARAPVGGPQAPGRRRGQRRFERQAAGEERLHLPRQGQKIAFVVEALMEKAANVADQDAGTSLWGVSARRCCDGDACAPAGHVSL